MKKGNDLVMYFIIAIIHSSINEIIYNSKNCIYIYADIVLEKMQCLEHVMRQ